ncbi:MAG: acetyl-CoA synthase subunit gamma [Deltaproteobacteria bacterium]|nr:acetyl-CoA synthase subunit gamma [Deltaproteobacteria bacterium]
MKTADTSWFEGTVGTPAGDVPRVRTSLTSRDRRDAVALRWGIGRSAYTVPPGLYAVGSPSAESVVLVSANYKMSFDRLRRELSGIDAWILVLDTKGINVWCAAGKGTFGTDELVNRVEAADLGQVVSHRRLVLPQLGAPGVSAHEVRKRSGFQVVYGPVRAPDLPRFLSAGMKADPEMRRVRFGLADRAAVVPVEIVQGAGYALLIAALFVILGGLGPDGYRLDHVLSVGIPDAILVLGAFLGGSLLTPLLLPFLPGRPFAWKGMCMGLLVTLALWAALHGLPGTPGALALAAWLTMGSALASFLAMNFTGASTYTSLSGVRKEMRFAVPVQVVAVTAGLVFWAVARFTGQQG